MPIKFTVFDKETAKEIKKILKGRKKNYIVKKKNDDELKDLQPDSFKPEPIKENNPKPKPKRKRLTKAEKEAKRKQRTPEEQAAINERMARLRELRKKRQAKKNN